MINSNFLKVCAATALLLGLQTALPAISSSAFADDDTDFVCWDLDDGGVECEEYDLLVSQCQGNDDVYPCDSIDQDEARLNLGHQFNPSGNFAAQNRQVQQAFSVFR